jgi:hypothetical protein
VSIADASIILSAAMSRRSIDRPIESSVEQFGPIASRFLFSVTSHFCRASTFNEKFHNLSPSAGRQRTLIVCFESHLRYLRFDISDIEFNQKREEPAQSHSPVFHRSACLQKQIRRGEGRGGEGRGAAGGQGA